MSVKPCGCCGDFPLKIPEKERPKALVLVAVTIIVTLGVAIAGALAFSEISFFAKIGAVGSQIMMYTGSALFGLTIIFIVQDRCRHTPEEEATKEEDIDTTVVDTTKEVDSTKGIDTTKDAHKSEDTDSTEDAALDGTNHILEDAGAILKKFVEGLPTPDDRESYVFVDRAFQSKKDDTTYGAGWYTQRHFSCHMGFAATPAKTEMQIKAETFGPFIFALSFSNCHTSVHIDEPAIFMPDPMPGADVGKLVLFPNVEFYFQYFKRALSIHSLPVKTVEQQKEKETLCAAYRADITKEEYRDPNNASAIGKQVMLPMSIIKKWGEEVAEEVMTAALFAKFSQNPLLGNMLKATENRRIVQLKTDPIWGPGNDGKGRNLLGNCLMTVRLALIQNRTIELNISGTKYKIGSDPAK